MRDVKAAYKKLSLKYHPDRATGNSECFLLIQSAYNELCKTISDDIWINLEDVLTGTTVDAHGANITVPPGIADNTKVKLNNRTFTIRIKKHKKFLRQNDNLCYHVNVSCIQVMCNIPYVFTDLSGDELSLIIPKTITTNKQIVIKGAGLPNFITGKRGDINLIVNLYIPELTDDHAAAIIKTIIHT